MTSLLPAPERARSEQDGPDEQARARVATPRPMVLVATLGGALAAATALGILLAVALVGWFLSDAGAHGAPRDALRVGGLAWLMAHGSGVVVRGVPITAVPLGLTLLCAWVCWRTGLRVGHLLSGHGPDADRIGDGERDWTVQLGVVLFSAGYVLVAVAVGTVAPTSATAPDTGRSMLWALVLSLLFGGPALAVGSGRAAIWAERLPVEARAAVVSGLSVLRWFLLVATLAWAAAFVADLGAAANVVSQLHADAGATTLIGVLSLVAAPTATVLAGSYLLGPGFVLGAGTLVSPGGVVLGALPMFPLLVALPDPGRPASWVAWLPLLAALAAAVGAFRAHRLHPTPSWVAGPLTGAVGGALAALAFAVAAWLSAGSIGPGRMQVMHPFVFDTLVAGVALLGLGGLAGGLLATWLTRRRAVAEA